MSRSPLSVSRFRIIYSICWAALSIDHILVLHWLHMPWKIAIIDSLISNGILFFCCLLVMNTLRYYLPRKEQYVHIFIWCILLTVFWFVLSKWLLTISLGYYEGYKSLLHYSLAIRFSIGFLLLGLMTMICVLWFNWGEQKENEIRSSDTERMAKEAELFKLRHQLQPHFLFNSLNSINALIGSRPEEARKMVQQLSDFLRGSIKKEEQQWVSLQEELQYLQLYLEIEKVRFGNRLSTVIETAPGTIEMKLPALLLQPIVENAIKFGLYDTTGDTVIRIETYKNNNELLIRVQNPFDPVTSVPRQGTGFGLKSVQRRLYLLFARNDLLTIQTADNMFITTVKIPQ
jgi:two-component system, LytTR family, sensor kinase